MSALIDFILLRSRHGTWRNVFTIVFPVFIGLLSYKLAKIFLYEIDNPFAKTPVSELEKILITGFIVLVPVVFVILLLIWRKVSKGKLLPPGTICLGLIVLLLISQSIFQFIYIIFGKGKGSDVLVLFELTRWDFVFVVGYTILVFLMLELTSGWKTTLFRTLFSVISCLLLTIASIEFIYFITTGSIGNGFLLKYLFAHFEDIAIIIANELYGINLLILLLSFSVFVFVHKMDAFHWMQKYLEQISNPKRSFIWLWIILGVLIFAPEFNAGNGLLPQYRENIFKVICSDLIGNSYWTELEIDQSDSIREPPFNNKGLKLIPMEDRSHKNIVLIILESARSSSCSAYDSLQLTTPFIKELSQKSLFVEQMYVVLPHTSKALVSILCGVFPAVTATSIESNQGGVSERALPNLLKPFEYSTAFFTPANLKFERDRELLENMGFEQIKGDGSYDTDGFKICNYFGYEDRIMLRPSLSWIDSVKKTDRPFFLAYLTLIGHHDYGTPNNFHHQNYGGVTDIQENDYLNAMRYIDDFLRDLFTQFKERGLYDSTVFVIIGDHGEAFGEHGLRQHDAVCYEEGLKVPALIFAPSIFHKKVSVLGLRQQIDLLPTITSLLGFRLTGGSLPGISLLEQVSPNRELIFSGLQENTFIAKRKGAWKYIFHYRKQSMELFNLDEDPDEYNNRGAELSFAAIDSLEKELILWKAGVNDVYLNFKSK